MNNFSVDKFNQSLFINCFMNNLYLDNFVRNPCFGEKIVCNSWDTSDTQFQSISSDCIRYSRCNVSGRQHYGWILVIGIDYPNCTDRYRKNCDV